jgi:hypothetical protein
MSRETKDELKAAGMFKLTKLRHASQVRILAMAKLLQAGIDQEHRRGEHWDYRPVTPLNNRTGQPLRKSKGGLS